MTICVFVLNSYLCVNKCYNLIIFNDKDFALTNTKKTLMLKCPTSKKWPKCPGPERPMAKLSYNRLVMVALPSPISLAIALTALFLSSISLTALFIVSIVKTALSFFSILVPWHPLIMKEVKQ